MALCWSGSARAECETRPFNGEDFILDEGKPTTLCGDIVAPNITIAGALSVAPMDSADPDPNRGWVHLKAETIRIESTAIIDATGAGYRANTTIPTDTSVSGPGAGTTPSLPASADEPRPGGGASHGGVGIAGLWGQAYPGCTPLPNTGCQVFAEAAPGPPYDNPDDPLALQSPQLGMGSAGGGSHTGCPNVLTTFRGGHGGGVVLLTAYRIEIGGQIRADGDNATTLLRSGPGGGSGGSIILRSRQLELMAPLLTARGGDGGYVDSDNIGGAGGGGLIVVMGPNITNGDLVGLVNVEGGTTGTPCNLHGGTGVVAALPPPSCIDADGDGVLHEACGGTDCLDGNPDVPRADGAELCNGLDDDCNGVVDGPDAACAAGTGLICVNSECVPDDGSNSSGGEKAESVEYRGGLCSVSSGVVCPRSTPQQGPLGWLAAAALLGLAWRRRP